MKFKPIYTHIAIALFVIILAVFFYIKVRNKLLLKKVNETATNNNLKAFLKSIRWAEGTDVKDGYKKLFGGSLFSDFSDHPNVKKGYTDLSGKSITTSAAGAYQFIFSTWKGLQKKLGLTDFSPENQDKAAVANIAQTGTLDLIIAGKIKEALQSKKLSAQWASLPYASANQPTKKESDFLKQYIQNGGQLTT